MIKRMIKNDFIRNKVITVTLVIFLILSSFLMAVGTMAFLQLRNSMEGIFDIAKPPHFLQMHTGELDQSAIDEFSNNFDYIDKEETVEMLNISAGSIWYEKQRNEKAVTVSMSDNQLDNGFVVQNTYLDYLLDLDNQIAYVDNGEIGVPISYMQAYDLRVGDQVVIGEGNFKKKFTIACFLRDAQMGSTMASSTRFLVSSDDHEELERHIGEMEYIIEYRFTDSKYASEFKLKYEAKDSNMPKNGQAITYPLIKLINGLSGGLLAGMMILVSMILIVIAIMNLRFTILATMEEEQREIGTMKAIGFSKKDVRELYVMKYRILAVIGCVVGYVLALPASGLLTKNIIMMFGEKKLQIYERILPLLATGIVYVLVIHFCKKILQRLEKITVVGALVYGEFVSEQVKASSKKSCKKNRKRKNSEKKNRVTSKTLSIQNTRIKNVNMYWALRELYLKKKSWLLIVFVMMLATSVIVIPKNLLNTFQSPQFFSNMGAAECDIEMDLNVKDSLQEKYEAINRELATDEAIRNYGVFASCRYEAYGEDGIEPFWVACGDYSKFAVPCLEGKMPVRKDEIALSYLNSQSFKVGVGDTIVVRINGEDRNFLVSGIYQDITSGGYTAKANMPYRAEDVQGYTIYANTKQASEVRQIVSKYESTFPYARVMPVDTIVKQTFGTVIESFQGAVVVAIGIGVVVAILITLLYMKLQLAKEHVQAATLKAIGFTSREIRLQHIVQMGITAVIGIVLGLIVSATVGESLVGFILKMTGMGMDRFRFIWNITFTAITCPVILLACSVFTTWLIQRQARRISIIDLMRE